MGCHSLHQGHFSNQGVNPGLLLCRQILYSLSHQEVYELIESPQNLYVEILTPKVVVLGGGDLWEVITSCGWSSQEWISVLINDAPSPSFCPVKAQ